jgi:hypothetical protein
MEDLFKMFRREAKDTSIQAAVSVYPDLRELQIDVLKYAETQPYGFTDEEMNIHFNTYRSTYRARRAELMHKGLIVDSGKKKKMSSGRNGIVWILPKFKIE